MGKRRYIERKLQFTDKDAGYKWCELRNGFLTYMEKQRQTLVWLQKEGTDTGYTKKGVESGIKTLKHFLEMDEEILDKLNYIVWDGTIGTK